MYYCVLDDVTAFCFITLVNSVALSFALFGEGEYFFYCGKMLHICWSFMKMSEFKRKPQLLTEICIIMCNV